MMRKHFVVSPWFFQSSTLCHICFIAAVKQEDKNLCRPMFWSEAVLEHGLDLILVPIPAASLNKTLLRHSWGGLFYWRWPIAGQSQRPSNGVSDEHHLLPLSCCVIAAPCFTVRSRGIRRAGGERPDWSSVFLQRGEEGSRPVAPQAGLPPETQRCNIVSDTDSAFAGNLLQFVSALVAFLLTFIVPQNTSEVCTSFEYKGFSVVPLNPLAMSSAFRWLCSLQWISLGLFEAFRHVVMITRWSLMWECLLSFSPCQHRGRALCQPSCNKGPTFHPEGEKKGKQVNCAVKHQTVITYGEPAEICKHLVCGECLRSVLFYSHDGKTKRCVLRVPGLDVLGRRGRHNKPQKNSSWLFTL